MKLLIPDVKQMYIYNNYHLEINCIVSTILKKNSLVNKYWQNCQNEWRM